MKLLFAMVFALTWVKATRVGPVVLVVSDDRGWGLHSGDLIGLVPLVGVLLFAMGEKKRDLIGHV